MRRRCLGRARYQITVECRSEYFNNTLLDSPSEIPEQTASFQIRNHGHQGTARRFAGIDARQSGKRGIPHLHDEISVGSKYADGIGNHAPSRFPALFVFLRTVGFPFERFPPSILFISSVNRCARSVRALASPDNDFAFAAFRAVTCRISDRPVNTLAEVSRCLRLDRVIKATSFEMLSIEVVMSRAARACSDVPFAT